MDQFRTDRRYTFCHIRFVQRELTFAEDGQVREILLRIAALASPHASLADFLDAVYHEGIAEDLFAVILKPYEPTVFHKAWNRIRAGYLGIPCDPLDGRSVIGRLKNSQVAEVLSDFFVINTSWMSSFSGIVSALGSGTTPARDQTRQ